jgi:thiamine pyrophosphate-dependent acetolactate synthase large subunit-like protein
MNVCEALLDILADYGVKYIFGIPGDAINELIEAIRKQDKISFIHVMHEEAGAFAASAQAKLTGELAVCAGTAGPGGIHLLNGLYDAKMDHAPVLAITGQVETSMIGTAYHQEVDLQVLFADVADFNQTIIDPAQMPEVATLAIQTALSKKGVAHISLPSNVAALKVPDYKKQKQIIYSRALVRPCGEDLQKAAELINQSSSPCILAGIGAKKAAEELLQFAGLIKAPIIKALRGKDILPDVHPYVLGGIGLLGTEPAMKAVKNCDLFIIIGSDFPYHDFYPAANVPTIQIEREAQQVGRRHPVDVALIGDAKLTLSELVQLVENKPDDSFLKESQRHMQDWLDREDEIELSKENPIHPQALARCIGDRINENAIITCDTGAVTVWGARNLRIRPGQLFTVSGGLASMGFGLPAAIGAQLLFPERQVVALCGDGGFSMLMADFATAVKYDLNIKVFIFNNSKLGLIQMEQEAHGNPEHETSLNNPDFAAFAIGCGGEGFTVKNTENLDEVIGKVLASGKASVVNVYVNPGELTWPPKVTFSEAINYTKAKITEYFIKNDHKH